MKRDLDLCRQLLADLEGHGPDCAVTALRPGVSGEAEETLRYHVRLLIDAGLAKEVDRPSAGVPCVRLTSAGHELLELAYSEALWREAKWVVGERTGTQSLTVIRAVLARWAYEAALSGEAYRPRRAPVVAGYAPERGYRPYTYRPAYHRVEPRYRFEPDVEPVVEPRVAAARPFRSPYAYVERFDWRAPVDWRDASGRETFYREPQYRETHYRDGLYREPAYRDGFLRDGQFAELDGVTLPTYVV